MAHRRGRKAAGFRTKSGAVKVQVLFHPIEHGVLALSAKTAKRSMSAVVREIVAFHFAYPAGPIEWDGHKKYQPRGFAKA